MTELIKLLSPACKLVNGIDQGTHNYILYALRNEFDKYPNFIRKIYKEFDWRVYSMSDSPVYHMRVLSQDEIRKNYNPALVKFIRPGKELPALVHQIDTVEEIHNSIINYYRNMNIDFAKN